MKGMREYISHGTKIDSIIAMEPSDFLLTRNQQETLTSPELKEYIIKQRARGSGNVKPFEVEYQKRFATPLLPLSLRLSGCLFLPVSEKEEWDSIWVSVWR